MSPVPHSTERVTTSIHAVVVSEKNESIRSLQNNSIVVIIKNDTNHNDIYHLKLNIDQISFPIQFNITNINGIKDTGPHLLSLLILGYTHRLLWEGTLFRQNLTVNHMNFVNFTVKDVSNLPKCLSEGYPCVDVDDVDNDLISMCCSDTKCQRSTTQQLTCGGKSPVVQNVTITYVLSMGMRPILGMLDKKLVDVTEKIFQSISVPGTIVKVINATIIAGSTNIVFFLKLRLSIITSESCEDCRVNTFHSIKNKLMPFNIPLQDGSSIIVTIQNPNINVTGITEGRITTQATSTISTTTLSKMISVTTMSTTLPESPTQTAQVFESSRQTAEPFTSSTRTTELLASSTQTAELSTSLTQTTELLASSIETAKLFISSIQTTELSTFSTETSTQCYYGKDQVNLVGGGQLSIERLKAGDRVWSLNSDGNSFIEDEIYMIPHVESNKSALFYTFTTTDKNRISLTGNHFIPVYISEENHIQILSASKVTVKHRLIMYNRKIAIENISIDVYYGYYGLFTLSGYLLVNNISTSNFAESPGVSANDIQRILAPLRSYYRLTRWYFGNEYNPFATDIKEGFHPIIKFSLQHEYKIILIYFALQYILPIIFIGLTFNLFLKIFFQSFHLYIKKYLSF